MNDHDCSRLSRRRFLKSLLLTSGAVVTGTAAQRLFAKAPQQTDFSFVVLADTHVGSAGDEERLEQALPLVAAEKPLFLLHAGDVVNDAVSNKAELESAKKLLSNLPAPLHAVPGNHDIGFSPKSGLLSTWEAAFGPSEHVSRFGGWSFVGFNSLFLTKACGDKKREDAVLAFLEKQLPDLDGRRTVLFYHLAEYEVPLKSAAIPWTTSALSRFQAFTKNLKPAVAIAGHWHLGIRIPLSASAHPLLIAPAISGRWNLPTGYLRCAVKADKLLFERVMIETGNKRQLPAIVKWFSLPEGKPPTL